MDIDDAVAMLAEDPRSTGIFCDFDGTLSPIVDRREDAIPVSGAAEVMRDLAHDFGIVAVVSGRSLADLIVRFAPKGVLLAGSYGRERSDRSAPALRSDRADELMAAADAGVRGLPGVVVEAKPTGIAIHYRLAPEHAADVGELARRLAREFTLDVRPGRMVAELIVPGPGKADALAELVDTSGVDRFVFAGDDAADVEAFAWARASARTCVLVGVRSSEGPDDIECSSDLMVDGPEGVVDLFARVREFVRGAG